MDWSLIVIAVLTIALLIGGGYIKSLLKNVKELVIAVSDAFADDKVDEQELALILKEARDVGTDIKAIIKAVVGLRARSNP